ncbi:hypothetical protein LMG19089_02344 [Ralstonia edaphis]|nr:hypothetical protein LMG19089_02344 [Ralstonia sp. LMG 6871]
MGGLAQVLRNATPWQGSCFMAQHFRFVRWLNEAIRATRTQIAGEV